MPSLTETEDSESDTENKGKALKTDPELERMKQKIGILEQEVKMAKMQTAIIKQEINNSRDLQDLLLLKKKHKINF